MKKHRGAGPLARSRPPGRLLSFLFAAPLLLFAAGPTEVNLRATWTTDGDLVDLAKMPDLRRLDLSRTRVTDRGIMYLKTAQKLEDVNLAFAEYVGDPIHAVVREWKSLKRINLRGTRVADATAAALAKLPHLEALDIALTDVQDFGLDAISTAPQLKELAMGGARTTDSAFQFLRELRTLTYLDISTPTLAITFRGGVNISDRALGAIASLQNLRDLRLAFNRFQGRKLSILKPLANLERLDLQFCEGVKDDAISQLVEWKSLKRVDLHGSGVTKEGIATLRTQRPDLKVLWE
jgi:hypothetical protein